MKTELYRAVLAAVMVIVVAGCTFAAPVGSPDPSGPVGSAAGTPGIGAEGDPTPAATTTPRRTASPRPTKAPTPAPTELADIPGLDDLLGSDGRFTVLLLGVDSRTQKLTGRTDTIMFATIDPNTGKVAMASLPRDMVFVPIGPGKTYGSGGTRVNALFAYLGGFGGGRKAQFRRMVKAMEYMSGIEIDRYAMIGFTGVRTLVSEIGGVNVVLPRALNDPYMHVRMKGSEGLKLKKGKNHLRGNVALAFARTRHTDSDYERGRRQQQLIAAVVKKVVQRGPEALPSLLPRVDAQIRTDIDLKDAPALLALAQRAKLGTFKSTVLGPSKYAGAGDVLYSTKLKIDVVRDYFRKQFGPVRR